MFDIEKARQKGIPESSIKIMEQINQNNACRESCTGHEFEMYKPGHWKCTKCGYVADVAYVLGYADALKHHAPGISCKI